MTVKSAPSPSPERRLVRQVVQNVSVAAGHVVGIDITETAVQVPTQDPANALLNLQLPQELLDLLSLPVLELGLTLTTDEARDAYSFIRRPFTLVKNNAGIRRALLYIPDWILDYASMANLSAINSMVFAFNPGSVLIIFSYLTRPPARSIKKVVEIGWFDARQVKGSFIPWRDVEELGSLNPEDRKLWIVEELKLQDLLSEAQEVVSVAQMHVEDITELVRIISYLPQLIDEAGRGWRLLFQNAGLNAFVGNFVLTGAPTRDIAWSVINQLKHYRRLQEKPDYEVLGLLLYHILTLEELPPIDKANIEGIIRKYVLVPPSRQL